MHTHCERSYYSVLLLRRHRRLMGEWQFKASSLKATYEKTGIMLYCFLPTFRFPVRCDS